MAPSLPPKFDAEETPQETIRRRKEVVQHVMPEGGRGPFNSAT